MHFFQCDYFLNIILGFRLQESELGGRVEAVEPAGEEARAPETEPMEDTQDAEEVPFSLEKTHC